MKEGSLWALRKPKSQTSLKTKQIFEDLKSLIKERNESNKLQKET
jgi:hypothetical protein